MTGYSAAKHAFDKECGVSGWTLHDLRRTFSTYLADLDVLPHIVERLLNHVSGEISEVAAIYNRSRYARPMREAIEKWEGYLAALGVGYDTLRAPSLNCVSTPVIRNRHSHSCSLVPKVCAIAATDCPRRRCRMSASLGSNMAPASQSASPSSPSEYSLRRSIPVGETSTRAGWCRRR